MALSLLAATPGLGAATAGTAPGEWQRFPDLPDPVGFGGMFAGVLGGRLVVGGGSQFREKPLWRQGVKSLSDRVYSLGAADARWTEEPFRLPEPAGHFASAEGDGALYLVGGATGAAGATAASRVLRRSGGGYALADLPDLPVPLVYGAAVVAGGRLHVAGGQNDPAVKAASAQTWSLDLARPEAGWQPGGDLPGPGVFVASMGTDGRSVFLFGGMAFEADGSMTPSRRAYRRAADGGAWTRIADLPEPRVGAATPCPLLADGRLLVIGGYAEIFPGPPREHPGFSEQTLVYDDRTGIWSPGPWLPRAPVADRDSPSDAAPGPVVAAPCVVWEGHAVVAGGESRSSVRTPAVIGWPMTE